MQSLPLFVLVVCCAAFIAALDVTSQLDDVVAIKITNALERLRLQPDGVPLKLLGIRRITLEPGQLELNIEALLELDGELTCNLRLLEETEERLEIVCGERQWRVVTPTEARALDETINSWNDIDAAELKLLEGRIIPQVIRVQDERRDPVLLLPVRLLSARRQRSALGVRTIIQARLGIPSRRCELELIERPSTYERLVITCGDLQWEIENGDLRQ